MMKDFNNRFLYVWRDVLLHVRGYGSAEARPFRGFTFYVVVFLFVSASVFSADEVFDPRTATMEELVSHAVRYGCTPEKLLNKHLAEEELTERGTEALIYLMERADIENIMIHLRIYQLVTSLNAEQGAPVLYTFTAHSNPIIRKIAAYFLGFYDISGLEYAEPSVTQLVEDYNGRMVFLMDDDETTGAAIRTLGKWKAKQAVSYILPYLNDEKERRRIVAVNALKDIKDPETIPNLIILLNDPVFTVREAAGKALVSFGEAAEKPVLKTLKSSPDIQVQRHCIRILGDLKSDKAVRLLRKLLTSNDWRIREDAAIALRQIDPEKADKWTKNVNVIAEKEL